jgi:hypothetical protein
MPQKLLLRKLLSNCCPIFLFSNNGTLDFYTHLAAYIRTINVSDNQCSYNCSF